MSSQRISLTEEEHKKAVSIVINDLRKKDLKGLLAAQRSNQLNEFIEPYLNEYINKKFSSIPPSPPATTITTATTTTSSLSPPKNKLQSSPPPSTSTSLIPKKEISKNNSNTSPPITPKQISNKQIHQVNNNNKNNNENDSDDNDDNNINDDDNDNNNENNNENKDEYKESESENESDLDINTSTSKLSPTNSEKFDYSPSVPRGRRISQYAGTAMESGCEVWAKPSGSDEWVKAIVRSITAVAPQESKFRQSKGNHKRLSMFVLDLQNDAGDIIGEIKLESSPVEGSLEEYEFVKLRNLVDDDEGDEGVEKVQDLITLSYLHEPAILSCLRKRFEKNLIYTNTGPILIAVNPFKNLSLYSQANVNIYKTAGDLGKGSLTQRPSPHVFQIADDAYRSMVENSLSQSSLKLIRSNSSSGNGGNHNNHNHNNISSENNLNSPNQSILVSGESGAGKTETTKFIMRYLADITSTHESTAIGSHSIENQVLQSNPILECFGNARTLRNDNSSRFGKFIEINFCQKNRDDRMFRITGATIRTYLLEKVRLVRQATGERNYHCFYEMLKGSSQDKLDELGLSSIWDFHYTNQSDMIERLDGVDDAEQFKITLNAMSILGFNEEEQDKVLKICAAVLHAGNITFDVKSGGTSGEDDGSKVSINCLYYLQTCCSLLELSEEELEKTLCIKTIVTPGKIYEKMVSVEEAEYARDAFAKTLYGALFDWLVQRVNKTIAHHEEPTNMNNTINSNNNNRQPNKNNNNHNHNMKSSFIGVLDIFGFENFDINSFEQLCINYTNETLQQHFNQFVFKHEQNLYEIEGISWDFIKFPDNSDVLDLLENKRTGLFALCDEQLRFPKATDKTLVNKFYEKCESHPRFYAGYKEKANDIFIVKHFAGHVTYSSKSFLEKNHDVVRPDMAQLIRQSSCWLVSSLTDFFRIEDDSLLTTPLNSGSKLQPTDSKSNSNIRRMSSRVISRSTSSTQKSTTTAKIQTLSGEFRSQLEDLMDNINTTSPHYVRCLKPNSQNIGDLFDAPLIIGQLRCGGVLEAVRVSRAGFPKRLSYISFIKAYEFYGWDIRPKIFSNNKETAETLCQLIAQKALNDITFIPNEDALGQTDKLLLAGIQCGKTLVFMRSRTFDFLERQKLLYHKKLAIRIQTQFRRYSAMNMYRITLHSIIMIQSIIRCFIAQRRIITKRKYNSAVKIQRNIRKFVVRSYIFRFLKGLKKLQAIIRGGIIRSKTKIQLRLYRYARIIQCAIRCKLSRKKLKSLRIEAKSLAKVMKDREELSKRLNESSTKWETEKKKIVETNRKELDQVKANLEVTILEKNKDKERIIELENELKSTEEDLRAIEFEFAEYKENDKSKEYISALEIELSTIRNDVTTYIERIGLSNLQLAEAKLEIKSYQEKQKTDQEAIDFLTNSCNELEEKITISAENFEIELNKVLLEKESQFDELTEVKSEVNDLRLLLDKKNLEINLLQFEKEKLNENIIELNEQIHHLSKEKQQENIQKQQQEQQEQRHHLPSPHELEIEYNEIDKNEINKLINDLDNAKQQILELENSLSKFQNLYDTESSDNILLNQKIEELTNNLSLRDSKIIELEESLTLIKQEKDSQISTLEEAIQTLLEQGVRNNNNNNDNDNTTTTNNNLDTNSDEELKQAINLLKHKDNEIEGLQLTIHNLEDDLKKLKTLQSNKSNSNINNNNNNQGNQKNKDNDIESKLLEKDNIIKKLEDKVESLQISLSVSKGGIKKTLDSDISSEVLSLLAEKDNFIKMLEERLEEKETEIQLLESTKIVDDDDNSISIVNSSILEEKNAKILSLEESNRDLQKHLQLLRKDRKNSKPGELMVVPDNLDQLSISKSRIETLEDTLSKLFEELQNIKKERDELKFEMLSVKNHDNIDNDRLISEVENLRDERDKLLEETTNLIEKYEHTKITSDDFEAKNIAAIKQIDTLRHEIDLKINENEKLKRKIEELEEIINENLESPDLTKSSITHSPLTPASDITPLSSITQVKPRERPNIPSKLIGRNIQPAALTALMNEIADEDNNDNYDEHDDDDDDDSSRHSSVTEVREIPLNQKSNSNNNNNNNNNSNDFQNKENNVNNELLKQELNEMKVRCQIAEYDANESLKKVVTLSSENELLKAELKDVNEELLLSRQRVESLQQRLANALNQSKQEISLPIQETRFVNGRPPNPLTSNNNNINNYERLSPQNPGYVLNNNNERNGKNGGSDYAGSDYGSVQGIPPSSGRRALVGGQRGSSGYYEDVDDGLNGWVGVGQSNPEGTSMQRRISTAFSNRLSSFDNGPRGSLGNGGIIGSGGSIHGDDLSLSHVSPNGGIGGVGNNGLYREKDTIICKRMSEWLIKNANIVPSRAATYAVTLVQNGQASLRRLEKSLRKDPDYLLHLGFDDDDAEEIADAINSESINNNNNNNRDNSNNNSNNNNNQSRLSSSDVTNQQQISQQQQQQQQLQQQRSSYIPPIDRRSLSPPYQGIAGRTIKNENNRNHNSYNADTASVRSFSSLPADFLADPEGMSPDKAFREARLARLEAQAQQAAELAQLASEDADRIAKTYRKGSFLRSNSGVSNSTSPKRRNTNSSSTSKKLVAQAHERAYLATARARDTAFLQATENVLNGNH